MSSLIRYLPLALSAAKRRHRVTLSQIAGLARQRRALAKLDDSQLSDIGLTRGEACREAMRPVWDPPANWLK